MWIRARVKIIEHSDSGMPLRMLGTHTDITERKRAQEALRISEEKFSKAFNLTPTLMGVADIENWQRIEVNETYIQTSGYSREELLSSTVGSLGVFKPDQIEQFIKLLKRDGSVRDFEAELRTKTGQKRSMLYSGEIFEIGGRKHSVVSGLDITERKQAQEALRVSEEKFSKAFNSNPSAIGIGELESLQRIDVNEAFIQISGYSREELLSNTIGSLGEFVLEQIEQFVKLLKQDGSVRNFEIKLRTKTGQERLMLYSGEVFEMDGRKHAVSSGQDITERKQAEQALKESNERYKNFVRLSIEAIFRYKFTKPLPIELPFEEQMEWVLENLRLEECNDVYAKMYDFENSREITGKTLVELRSGDEHAAREIIKPWLENNYKLTNYEDHIITKGGVDKFYIDNVISIIDDNMITDVWGTSLEITDRKQAEERLRDSEKRSRAWLENSPVCTKIVDLDFNLQYMSRAGIEGLKIDDVTEFYGKPFPLYFYPDQARDSITKCLEKVTETGEIVTGETSLFDLEGNEVWYYATFVPVKNDEGRIEYIIVVSVDTTERRQAEEAIANLAKFPSENPSPVLRIARDGTLLYANQASEPILQQWGCREGEFVGSEWSRIVSEVFETGKEKKIEREYAGRVWSFMIAPVIDSGYANLYCRDTTERKRAEEQIANLARFPSENPSPVLRIARDGTLLYANQASESILQEWGCREGEFVGSEWSRIVSEVFETGKEKKIEREHAGRVLSFMIAPVIEGDYANLYCRDTTERKRAEESLKLRFDLEELITSISTEFINLEPDEIDDGVERALKFMIDIACVDRAYIFRYSSDGSSMTNIYECCRTGVPPHKGRLQDVPVERFPWFNHKIKSLDAVVVDSVAMLTKEFEAGQNEWLYQDIQSLLCVPMISRDQLIGFIGFDTVLYQTEWTEEIITFLKILSTVFANTLDRKRADQEREHLTKILTAKNEELQSIVYVASHDLKSPLVNIQGFSGELAIACEQVETVLHGDKMPAEVQQKLVTVLDEDIPQCLSFISSSTSKMQSLLQGLLEVSRVGTSAFKTESINMNEMMKQIVTGMQFQITASGVDATIDDLPDCIGDTGRVNQIFTNIVNNAVNYLDPNRKGVIHISGKSEDGYSIYCVEDNGIGIAPAHQPKIFELFHRLDPEGSVKGDGLGLTIVRRILDREGGSIRVESEPGKGSRFFISLPHA
jgi:PAS domain S-box-containing protein